MGCACAANQFFHSPHTEWTPQAGIRKDGRINPDTNPGGNVSDVGRWKLGDIRSWGSPANGQEKLQPNFGAHVKICAFYCMQTKTNLTLFAPAYLSVSKDRGVWVWFWLGVQFFFGNDLSDWEREHICFLPIHTTTTMKIIINFTTILSCEYMEGKDI